jgi:hypothetical protein
VGDQKEPRLAAFRGAVGVGIGGVGGGVDGSGGGGGGCKQLFFVIKAICACFCV